MKFHSCALIGVLALGCGGCASTRLVVPAGTPVSAKGDVESCQTNTVTMRLVAAEFGRDLQHTPSLRIWVTNGEAASIAFSSENVSAFSGEHRVRIYAPQDYTQQVRREWQLRATQIQNTTASKQNALQTSFSNPGMPSGIELATDSMTQIQTLRSTVQKQLAEALQLLYPISIPLRTTGGGAVRLHGEDIERGMPLKVIVRAGSETHVFILDVQ